MDSCHKLSILATLGFGASVKPSDIFTEGIENIEHADIEYARNWGYAVKLLAIGKKTGKEVDVRVHPTLIPAEKLLANVRDENNAIFIKGDMVGEELFYGKGAGSLPTASSVISDILEIAKFTNAPAREMIPQSGLGICGDCRIVPVRSLNMRYYVRFSAIDRPGVLAAISRVLAQHRISIATVTQKGRKKGQPVPIVMLTHEANEGSMQRAIMAIDRLSFISRKSVKIRIER